MAMTALPTARLLPFLMLMALLMLGTRSYSFWQEWNYGGRAVASPPTAPRQQEAAPAAPVVEKPAEVPGSAMVGAGQPRPADAPSPLAPRPQDEFPSEFTPAEVQVLQTLGQRRAALDRRAAELDQREALLQAAQQTVEEKVKELQDLRKELQDLLRTADTQQNSRIASLVKIYETMKPREAAAILEGLDMTVALDVLEAMKETKSAPILASMDPQKASAITVEMSRRRQLPQIPQE